MGHTDELGGEANKIGWGQILKDLNPLGTGESFFLWKHGKNTLDLVSKKETSKTMWKIELEWEETCQPY